MLGYLLLNIVLGFLDSLLALRLALRVRTRRCTKYQQHTNYERDNRGSSAACVPRDDLQGIPPLLRVSFRSKPHSREEWSRNPGYVGVGADKIKAMSTIYPGLNSSAVPGSSLKQLISKILADGKPHSSRTSEWGDPLSK